MATTTETKTTGTYYFRVSFPMEYDIPVDAEQGLSPREAAELVGRSNLGRATEGDSNWDTMKNEWCNIMDGEGEVLYAYFSPDTGEEDIYITPDGKYLTEEEYEDSEHYCQPWYIPSKEGYVEAQEVSPKQKLSLGQRYLNMAIQLLSNTEGNPVDMNLLADMVDELNQVTMVKNYGENSGEGN